MQRWSYFFVKYENAAQKARASNKTVEDDGLFCLVWYCFCYYILFTISIYYL